MDLRHHTCIYMVLSHPPTTPTHKMPRPLTTPTHLAVLTAVESIRILTIDEELSNDFEAILKEYRSRLNDFNRSYRQETTPTQVT